MTSKRALTMTAHVEPRWPKPHAIGSDKPKRTAIADDNIRNTSAAMVEPNGLTRRNSTTGRNSAHFVHRGDVRQAAAVVTATAQITNTARERRNSKMVISGQTPHQVVRGKAQQRRARSARRGSAVVLC